MKIISEQCQVINQIIDALKALQKLMPGYDQSNHKKTNEFGY